ncbi:BAG domain [Dillenia turbinata]|uniref:BAG domain n=1 Tax=Dillenia turbinata TaxID=194707 RepID=A0AAN8UYN5_9MAGN
MKANRKTRVFSSSSSTTTVTYTTHSNDQPKTTEIPITSSETPPQPITVHLPLSLQSSAATKIQAAYRSHLIRTLFRKISAVNSEANSLERTIQRQETVDLIRSNDREKIRINEALMSLLLRLDSVPGVVPTVRELRRRVSRRIVGLQEVVDGICDERVRDWDVFLRNWDEAFEEIEESVCKERGGYEMEKFCADKLGFRCFQRFLREP